MRFGQFANRRAAARGACILLASLLFVPSLACGQPHCATLAFAFWSAPFAEKFAQADAVVLVSWISSEKGEGAELGTTTFKVERVLKAPAPLRKGDQYVHGEYTPGKPGQRFMIFGFREEPFVWWPVIEANEPTLSYALAAPSPTRPAGTRLAYFTRFLEDSEPAIANDAFLEVCHSSLDDLAGMAKELPRDKLRKWCVDAQTPDLRRGWYAIWLGLCGNDDDVRLLERKILEPTDKARPDISGVIAGYLLLSGEKGLVVIEREKIEQTGAGSTNEAWATMAALRTVWAHGDRPISRERLCQSMRLFLDHPDCAAEAIKTLARWKDWSVQDRLMMLYDAREFTDPAIKRTIVRYLLDCVEATAGRDENAKINVHANELLDGLRKKDPKSVQKAQDVYWP